MSEFEVDTRSALMSAAALAPHTRRMRSALARLDASDDGDFLRVAHDRTALRRLSAVVRDVSPQITTVVQLGIGGSSLGAHALCRALAVESKRRWHFPDNVDPESFGALLDRLDPKKTLVHVVSKSGGTIETLAQLDVLGAAWGRRRTRASYVVTTGSGGALRAFAASVGAPVLDFPEHVSGRFSVFTPSGLLLPAVCGVPVSRVLAGARVMEARCRAERFAGPAGRLAATYYAHQADAGRAMHVELIYSDALLAFGNWFAQIWAESLGKGGAGPTPITARGTTDQHSQIQLYTDGPDDKLYTVVRVNRLRRKLWQSRDATPEILRGRELGELFAAECSGTIEALRAAGRPVIELVFDRITPAAIGQLLLCQQLQTALAGELYGVYPFDQPGVEAGKKAAIRFLAATAKRAKP